MNEKIRKVLLNNNLGEYIEIFENQKLDNIEILKNLTENDYEKIGITILGDRKKLLRIFSNKIGVKKISRSNNSLSSIALLLLIIFGFGGLIFIVTVSVITYNILNR